MTKILCDNCKSVIDVPNGYNEPFIQCPECRAIQKYVRQLEAGEPKFKILDEKGIERAANQVVGDEIENIQEPPQIILRPKTQIQKPPALVHIPLNTRPKIIDQRKLLIDSIGEEGLEKALALVAKYINSSEGRKKKARVKAIQQLMKDKYPVDLATRAIEYAEKAPETQELIKSNSSQNIIICIVVVILVIVALVIFLI